MLGDYAKELRSHMKDEVELTQIEAEGLALAWARFIKHPELSPDESGRLEREAKKKSWDLAKRLSKKYGFNGRRALSVEGTDKAETVRLVMSVPAQEAEAVEILDALSATLLKIIPW